MAIALLPDLAPPGSAPAGRRVGLRHAARPPQFEKCDVRTPILNCHPRRDLICADGPTVFLGEHVGVEMGDPLLALLRDAQIRDLFRTCFRCHRRKRVHECNSRR